MSRNTSFSHLSVLSKRQCSAVDVKYACDTVFMCVVWQNSCLFAVVVQVATVCTIQPHVCSRPVAVITHRPLAHSNTCAFIATVLFHYVKLQHSSISNSLRTDL